MPSCGHRTTHSWHQRRTVWPLVLQGKKNITAQMVATINKHIRKQNKEKLFPIKENSLFSTGRKCYNLLQGHK